MVSETVSAASGLRAATVPFAAVTFPPRRFRNGPPVVEMVRLRASSDSIFFRIAYNSITSQHQNNFKRVKQTHSSACDSLCYRKQRREDALLTSSRLLCFRRVSFKNDPDACECEPDTPDAMLSGLFGGRPSGESRPSVGKCTAGGGRACDAGWGIFDISRRPRSESVQIRELELRYLVPALL